MSSRPDIFNAKGIKSTATPKEGGLSDPKSVFLDQRPKGFVSQRANGDSELVIRLSEKEHLCDPCEL